MFARDVHKLKMANFQFNVNYTKVSDAVPSNLHDSNGDRATHEQYSCLFTHRQRSMYTLLALILKC